MASQYSTVDVPTGGVFILRFGNNNEIICVLHSSVTKPFFCVIVADNRIIFIYIRRPEVCQVFNSKIRILCIDIFERH